MSGAVPPLTCLYGIKKTKFLRAHSVTDKKNKDGQIIMKLLSLLRGEVDLHDHKFVLNLMQPCERECNNT
jgi:hypothetical protein